MVDPQNEDTRRAKAGVGDDACDAVLQGNGNNKFLALRAAVLDRRLTVSDHRLYAELLAQPLYERGGVMACRPSRARLASGSTLDPANVKRSVRKLAALGYIEVKFGTGRSTSQYRLMELSRGVSLLHPAGSNQTPLKDRRGVQPDPPRVRRGVQPDPLLLEEPQQIAEDRAFRPNPSDSDRPPESENTHTGLQAKPVDKAATRLALVTENAIETFNAAPFTRAHGGVVSNVAKVGRKERQRQIGKCLVTVREIAEHIGIEPGSVEFWEAYWQTVDADAFCSGRQGGGEGHQNWRPDFEFLVKPKTMAKLFDKAVSE